MTRSVEIGKAMIRDLPVLLLPLFLGVAMITSASFRVATESIPRMANVRLSRPLVADREA